MAVQIQFTVSDAMYAEVFELSKDLGLSVGQYARIVFLANRNMDKRVLKQAQIDDFDRREKERRDRDELRRNPSRGVKRVDGGGYGQV